MADLSRNRDRAWIDSNPRPAAEKAAGPPSHLKHYEWFASQLTDGVLRMVHTDAAEKVLDSNLQPLDPENERAPDYVADIK